MQATIRRASWIATLGFVLSAVPAAAQPAPARDLSKTPTLYVVPYAHLDTQWNWDITKTITEYLPKTLHTNFDYFEKYPHYVFNFTGSNRYRLIQEYYPKDFEKLKKYIRAGRWFPAGSSVEEGDVNVPSAEAIYRQLLYGSGYFMREFGTASNEYMLPDSFGFPASLPSILWHSGIVGFSTQKLEARWQPATPPPFNVGIWLGPDGKGAIAAFNPGSYQSKVNYDLTKAPPAGLAGAVDWRARIQDNGLASQVFTDYHYVGTGDTGGGPDEASVKMLEQIVTKAKEGETTFGDGPLKIDMGRADQMFLDILAHRESVKMSAYGGDLELINHSAGSLTSQAQHKAWNRRNEVLADAAERASVAAFHLGVRAYPVGRLSQAWNQVLAGHFHDIMAGTSNPKVYEYVWNDDVIAMNQFAEVLSSASEGVASLLDTRGSPGSNSAGGIPIVVFNQLEISREDIVEASIQAPKAAFEIVRVKGPDGWEGPAQYQDGKVIFLAKTLPVSYSVFHVFFDPPASFGARPASTLHATLNATGNSLENDRYRVKLDDNGDIASVFDKQFDKELLSAPMRLQLQAETPDRYPAWNMDWKDQQMPPRGFVTGPAKVRIVEHGPARIALEVTRETEGSRFVQTIRLSAGTAGNRVEIANAIDWKIGATALKAAFPLSAASELATYNWDVGSLTRGNNNPKQFEVASHQWVDLTDKSGTFGVTILTDAKTGSDKPDNNTLRLTLLYSPGIAANAKRYSYMASNDWGHHEFTYGLAGHGSDFRAEQTDWQAFRLNEPLIGFESTPHPGIPALGDRYSLLSVSSNRVRVLALKNAERGNNVVVRIVEMDGKKQDKVHLTFADGIWQAREVNARELNPTSYRTDDDHLRMITVDLRPFETRTFMLTVRGAAQTERGDEPKWWAVTLPLDRSVSSTDGAKSAPGFDDRGNALPAEMLPNTIAYNGIQFALGLSGTSFPNALTAAGQVLQLPKYGRRVYVLAASASGDQSTVFRLGDQTHAMTIHDWSGYIGQWDNRQWTATSTQPFDTMTSITPGYIKNAPIAWYASHHHNATGGNETYAYSYLYAYQMTIPQGAKTITLPRNDKVRILAMTVSDEGEVLSPIRVNLNQ